jgi:hypothetical protein
MSNHLGKSDVAGDDVAWSPPVKRAEMAHARAEELRSRRAELARGVPAALDMAATAHCRAEEAVVRAKGASRAARHRHVEAQQAHLRAAAAHEQAAMTVGEQQCDLHQSAAERHRAAAAFHEATITESTSIKPPDDPSVDFLHQQ